MAKDYLNNTSTVTVGEWFIANILLLIPILNIIFLVKWAFSSTEKESKSNWAKFMLIYMVMILVIGGLIYISTLIATLHP